MRRLVMLLLGLLCLCAGAGAYASCTAPANAIEAENCLPGNPSGDWQINYSGDATLQGFATSMSVNVGQTIGFKIKTTASRYTIGIFRMGYYGGQGARNVANILPSAALPQTQPACLTDPATKLLDCGNWALSASWTVPANAVSGIYIAVLVRPDTGGASAIYFVVRDDSSHSDLLFQTSDETWQAYNPYGGNSLYGDTAFNLPARAYKVSYNRPFTTPDLETATWIYNAEYPMVRFLEANGYDVSYFSSVDAATNGSLIQNHKAFLSVGHDEYWSGDRRTNVEAARAAGVNLAFFSGNEMFWKTRWENSIDGSGTPNRTLVCYKETLAGAKIDPSPLWTGTWRDPSFSPPSDGGRPENGVTGTLFRVNGPGTDNTNLSMKVPAADGQKRFWRNTPVGRQTAGQTATLPAGTLGYEWDVDEDNGSRPAGLVTLSNSTYALTVDYLQDYGGVYGAGTATHKLALYRAYRNLGQSTQTPLGLVFGAGTVQWAWGLDANHANAIGTNPDPSMQQATVNLFADMGIQPATLQAGLVTASASTDNAAPSSTIVTPAANATLTYGTQVTVSGTATDFGGGIVAGVEVSVDGGSTWHAATGTTSWSYAFTVLSSGSLTIRSRAVDDSANLEIPSPGVTVNIPAPPVTTDAQAFGDSGGAAASVTSAALTTSAGNELLLAFVATDSLGTPNTTVTGVSGGGLTWTLVARTNTQPGTSEIWRAVAPGALTNVTVTASLSRAVSASILVVSFSGADTSGTNGSGGIGATASKSATTGAPSASLVTTRASSLVFAVGNDYDNALARTPASGQTLVHQYLSPVGDTYWMQRINLPILTAGTTATISDSSPTGDRYNLTLVEVLAPPYAIAGTVAPALLGAGVAMTLTGAVDRTTVTDNGGVYSFAGLPDGTYDVTPAAPGLSFQPSSSRVTIAEGAITGVDFVAAIATADADIPMLPQWAALLFASTLAVGARRLLHRRGPMTR